MRKRSTVPAPRKFDLDTLQRAWEGLNRNIMAMQEEIISELAALSNQTAINTTEITRVDNSSTVVGGDTTGGGGGGSTPDLTDYFFLPGRSGGQIAFGGTDPGDDLFLGSTDDATLGRIIFEATDMTGMVFEQNALSQGRLIIGGDFDPTDALFAGGVLQFLVEGEDGGGFTNIGVFYAGSGNPNIVGFRANGDLTTPTETLNGDQLFTIEVHGYDDTDTLVALPAAALAFTQDQSATTGIVPSNIIFKTTNPAGSLDSRMIVTSEGLVGIGTTGPLVRLAVAGFIRYDGVQRLHAQFDATTATLADISDLAVSIEAGEGYRFRALLYVDADATGGHQYAIVSGGTIGTLVYQINSIDNSTGQYVITSRQTTSGGAAGEATATTILTEIVGFIVLGIGASPVDLVPQFAQNSANGTSSVLAGSTFEVWHIDSDGP